MGKPFKSVYIYGLFSPIDDQCYYIGKSTNVDKRLSQHLNDKAITPKTIWVNSLAEAELVPNLKILETTTIKGWIEAEKKWIAYGFENGWPLTNIKNGGEGASKDGAILAAYEKYIAPYVSTETNKMAMGLGTNALLDLICFNAKEIDLKAIRLYLDGKGFYNPCVPLGREKATNKFLLSYSYKQLSLL